MLIAQIIMCSSQKSCEECALCSSQSTFMLGCYVLFTQIMLLIRKNHDEDHKMMRGGCSVLFAKIMVKMAKTCEEDALCSSQKIMMKITKTCEEDAVCSSQKMVMKISKLARSTLCALRNFLLFVGRSGRFWGRWKAVENANRSVYR